MAKPLLGGQSDAAVLDVIGDVVVHNQVVMRRASLVGQQNAPNIVMYVIVDELRVTDRPQMEGLAAIARDRAGRSALPHRDQSPGPLVVVAELVVRNRQMRGLHGKEAFKRRIFYREPLDLRTSP
jgi:hypothetical protein